MLDLNVKTRTTAGEAVSGARAEAGGAERSREEVMIDGSHLCPTGMGLCKWRIREAR